MVYISQEKAYPWNILKNCRGKEQLKIFALPLPSRLTSPLK